MPGSADPPSEQLFDPDTTVKKKKKKTFSLTSHVNKAKIITRHDGGGHPSSRHVIIVPTITFFLFSSGAKPEIRECAARRCSLCPTAVGGCRQPLPPRRAAPRGAALPKQTKPVELARPKPTHRSPRGRPRHANRRGRQLQIENFEGGLEARSPSRRRRRPQNILIGLLWQKDNKVPQVQ